jgi:hypothetical protein
LSRLENAATRKDIYRLAVAFVDQFIASYAQPPAVIVLDLDHSEDAAYGQQELIFYNAHYQSHCYLPLFIFEGLSGKFITAALRPGKRPTGAENAMIVKRVLKRLRAAWPDTHLILRGDAHFANPELMQLVLADPQADFIFGLSSNAILKPLAQPFLEATRRQHDVRCENARRHHQPVPVATQTYHELDYAAKTWPQPFRVVLNAEVMALGDNPRFVVTSLDRPTPQSLYCDLYCARGQDENWIKMLKNDLASDRTSDHRFLANHLRLFFACGAYVLHQALRTEVLVHTELAQAQPATVILKLFKIAVRVVQYKDRIQTASAQQLPGQGPPAPGHRNSVSGPRTRLGYLLRRQPTPTHCRHCLAFPPSTAPFCPSPFLRPRSSAFQILQSPHRPRSASKMQLPCWATVHVRRISAPWGLSSQVYETFGCYCFIGVLSEKHAV